MPKPYAHWDPALNPALHVRALAGPLVIDVPNEINHTLLAYLVGHACGQPMLDDENVGYVEMLDSVEGSGPNAGVRVQQYDVMPTGLAFYGVDATNGEPRPFDDCDAIGAPWSLQTPYLTLGYRAVLRGYVCSVPQGALATDVRVTWADGVGTRSAASPRGGYTGALLRAMSLDPTVDPAMHYAYAVAHGKRPTTDSAWSYHPGKIAPGGVTAGGLTTANGLAGGQLRLVTYGGPPTWTVLLQHWTGSAWETLYTTTDDFLTEQTAGYESYVGLVAELFAGAGLVQASPPTGDPPLTTWFSRLELPQFEPWVVDCSSWSAREWSRHWEWLTMTYTAYYPPRRRPVMDLQHVPLGLPGAPTELRISDPDLGACVSFNRDTWLFAAPPWDMTGMLYTTGGIVHAAVCDEGAYGYQAPFAMQGRFRFTNMATWALDRVIMVAGETWAATPGTANGMGVHWHPLGTTPGDGTLVLRAYDDTASAWVSVEHQFNASTYDDTPVDLAFAWTGARGATIGRDDYELRLVIDGVTVAALTNADIRLKGSKRILIGTYQGVLATVTQRSFEGLLREAMVFADAVTDADLRAAFASSGALDNPSFEIAHPTARPGEAAGWVWQSVQQVGGWAAFNQYRADLQQWWTACEDFAAGYRYPYTWSYADEAERLAATGFTLADLNHTAWQRDDDSYWLLTGVGPTAWTRVVLPTHEAWVDALAPGTTPAALFNEATPFEASREDFDLWSYQGLIVPPWFDTYALVSPAEDVVGFDGWYDALFGTTAYPLEADAFGEAWGTDPLSTAPGPLWASGACPNGTLYGAALTFPVTIRPGQARLIVYADYGTAYFLDLLTGTYTTAVTLAAMLQAAWVASAGSSTGLAFASSGDRITFGWDGSPTAIMVLFGVLASQRHYDVRPVIGFNALGPLGQMGRLPVPAATVVMQPSDVDSVDSYWLDPWSTIHFRTEHDSGILVVLEYDWTAALYDSASTMTEHFTFPGWFGLGAAWKGSYTPGDLTAALFNSGVDDVEHFASANWPDEGYPL